MSRALGRYELLRPLARGGMGEVYLARRRAAGVEKWLVVKRMRPEKAGDTRFLELFMREARLTMSLTHQNIVPVFDFGRIDDQVFLAMERIEGKDLGSSLTKWGLANGGKGVPPLLAAWITAECLQALDYAHRRKSPDGAELGIVHRDVTPRNVLLSWAGEVKLTDFGIAALAGDATSKATGTPAYMAPEQARGEALDVRADIYAVGLVLREALTGQRARRGNEKEGVLELAQKGELEPWPPGIDDKLAAIADKATAADKEARYPDARSMLEALDTFIVGERAAHKTESPARQLATWLGDLWKGAREDEDNIDAQIDGNVLVSFIDDGDGALDVMGTGTQRSALATADETPVPELAAPAPAPLPSEPPRRASRLPTEHVEPLLAPGVPSRSRLPLVLVLGALVVGAVIFMLMRTGERPPATAPLDAQAVALATDAAVLEHRLPVDASMDVDAAVAAVPLDAAVEIVATRPDAGRAIVRTRPDAGAARLPPTDAVTAKPRTRKVTINSKPTWSNWTVDGGPPHSGVETIELTPGKHVIHFTGNPYYKADKKVTIDVPDRDGFTHVETLEQIAP